MWGWNSNGQNNNWGNWGGNGGNNQQGNTSKQGNDWGGNSGSGNSSSGWANWNDYASKNNSYGSSSNNNNSWGSNSNGNRGANNSLSNHQPKKDGKVCQGTGQSNTSSGNTWGSSNPTNQSNQTGWSWNKPNPNNNVSYWYNEPNSSNSNKNSSNSNNSWGSSWGPYNNSSWNGSGSNNNSWTNNNTSWNNNNSGSNNNWPQNASSNSNFQTGQVSYQPWGPYGAQSGWPAPPTQKKQKGKNEEWCLPITWQRSFRENSSLEIQINNCQKWGDNKNNLQKSSEKSQESLSPCLSEEESSKSAGPVPSSTTEKSTVQGDFNAKECKICLNGQSTMMNRTCRHLLMCLPCYQQYRNKHYGNQQLRGPGGKTVGEYVEYIAPIYS